jgi:Skp family chaperone for outer membrane proteins
MKRRVLVRKVGAAAAVAAMALPALGMGVAVAEADVQLAADDQVDRLAESLQRIREMEMEIEDLRDDLQAAPWLLEQERAKAREQALEIEQWRDRAVQQKQERRQYLAERDEARCLAVRCMRGELVEVPPWAEHPYYGGPV